MQIFNHSFISLGDYTDEEKEAILRLKKRKSKPILKKFMAKKMKLIWRYCISFIGGAEL